MLRIGKGEEEVFKELLVVTQNERINELKTSMAIKEEEQDSFKECCDCDGQSQSRIPLGQR